MKITGFKLLFLFVAALCVAGCASTREAESVYSIYLVRHAEKADGASMAGNPPLSECGTRRAENLVVFFDSIKLKAVYSTDYIRTKSTAAPVAKSKALEITDYSPKNLQKIAEMLLAGKQDVLIVGHSNTTAELAGILLGEKISAMNEDIYDRIYQVVIYKNSRRMYLYHSGFVCQ